MFTNLPSMPFHVAAQYAFEDFRFCVLQNMFNNAIRFVVGKNRHVFLAGLWKMWYLKNLFFKWIVPQSGISASSAPVPILSILSLTCQMRSEKCGNSLTSTCSNNSFTAFFFISMFSLTFFLCVVWNYLKLFECLRKIWNGVIVKTKFHKLFDRTIYLTFKTMSSQYISLPRPFRCYQYSPAWETTTVCTWQLTLDAFSTLAFQKRHEI